MFAKGDWAGACIKVYLAPKVLVFDEMCYLALDYFGATIFFQLVSARYDVAASY